MHFVGGPRKTWTLNLTVRSGALYPIELAVHINNIFYIGIYRTIHQNFNVIFWISIWRSLTVQTNQSITRYKVLNLLLGPLPLKISFNFRKHAFGSYFFCYEIIRVKRDRGEAAIEFICFNKWYEAKLRKKRSFDRSCVAMFQTLHQECVHAE